MDKRATTACAAAGASLALISELLNAHGAPEEVVIEAVAALSLALRLNLECTPGAYGLDELLDAVRHEMLHLHGAAAAGVTLQ